MSRPQQTIIVPSANPYSGIPSAIIPQQSVNQQIYNSVDIQKSQVILAPSTSTSQIVKIVGTSNIQQMPTTDYYRKQEARKSISRAIFQPTRSAFLSDHSEYSMPAQQIPANFPPALPNEKLQKVSTSELEIGSDGNMMAEKEEEELSLNILDKEEVKKSDGTSMNEKIQKPDACASPKRDLLIPTKPQILSELNSETTNDTQISVSSASESSLDMLELEKPDTRASPSTEEEISCIDLDSNSGSIEILQPESAVDKQNQSQIDSENLVEDQKTEGNTLPENDEKLVDPKKAVKVEAIREQVTEKCENLEKTEKPEETLKKPTKKKRKKEFGKQEEVATKYNFRQKNEKKADSKPCAETKSKKSLKTRSESHQEPAKTAQIIVSSEPLDTEKSDVMENSHKAKKQQKSFHKIAENEDFKLYAQSFSLPFKGFEKSPERRSRKFSEKFYEYVRKAGSEVLPSVQEEEGVNEDLKPATAEPSTETCEDVDLLEPSKTPDSQEILPDIGGSLIIETGKTSTVECPENPEESPQFESSALTLSTVDFLENSSCEGNEIVHISQLTEIQEIPINQESQFKQISLTEASLQNSSDSAQISTTELAADNLIDVSQSEKNSIVPQNTNGKTIIAIRKSSKISKYLSSLKKGNKKGEKKLAVPEKETATSEKSITSKISDESVDETTSKEVSVIQSPQTTTSDIVAPATDLEQVPGDIEKSVIPSTKMLEFSKEYNSVESPSEAIVVGSEGEKNQQLNSILESSQEKLQVEEVPLSQVPEIVSKNPEEECIRSTEIEKSNLLPEINQEPLELPQEIVQRPENLLVEMKSSEIEEIVEDPLKPLETESEKSQSTTQELSKEAEIDRKAEEPTKRKIRKVAPKLIGLVRSKLKRKEENTQDTEAKMLKMDDEQTKVNFESQVTSKVAITEEEIEIEKPVSIQVSEIPTQEAPKLPESIAESEENHPIQTTIPSSLEEPSADTDTSLIQSSSTSLSKLPEIPFEKTPEKLLEENKTQPAYQSTFLEFLSASEIKISCQEASEVIKSPTMKRLSVDSAPDNFDLDLTANLDSDSEIEVEKSPSLLDTKPVEIVAEKPEEGEKDNSLKVSIPINIIKKLPEKSSPVEKENISPKEKPIEISTKSPVKSPAKKRFRITSVSSDSSDCEPLIKRVKKEKLIKPVEQPPKKPKKKLLAPPVIKKPVKQIVVVCPESLNNREVPYKDLVELLELAVPRKGRKTNQIKIELARQRVEVEKKMREMTHFKCGKCKIEVPKQEWLKHMWYDSGLAWMEGFEPPLSIDNYIDAQRRVQHMFRLLKMPSVNCRNCNEPRMSGPGVVSHVINCGQSQEKIESHKIQCEYCDEKLMPYSVQNHKKTCRGLKVEDAVEERVCEGNEDDEPMESNGRHKRKAVKK